MPEIQVLDPQVASQIAAGEVVSRPASAVKELLENAIDAGARKITVRTSQGGLQSIDVTDDGSGMTAEDARQAMVRHATSKLRSITDLERLRTLGFRGEALPAIAAVSRMTVRTRSESEDAGTSLQFSALECVRQEIVGCPVGTRVIVEDLFFNTPARLKFVRSLPTENRHIALAVMRAAASRPEIAFRLEQDGRETLRTPGDGLLASVFLAVHGSDAAADAVAVVGDGPLSALGLVAAPRLSRSTRLDLWFSVNGRPIHSLALADAVVAGIGERMHKGRYPIAMISLWMDPQRVDVNVHPAKLEVRFSNESEVRETLSRWVDEALHVQISAEQLATPRYHGASAGAAGPPSHEWCAADPVLHAHDVSVPVAADELPALTRGSERPLLVRERALPLSPASVQAALDLHVSKFESEVSGIGSSAVPAQVPAPPPSPRGEEASYNGRGALRVVGQALAMYIIAQDEDAVYIIDQHAAHERVLYDRFLAQTRQEPASALPLLVPLVCTIAPGASERILEHREEARAVGLEFESFGPDTIAVRAIPAMWEGLDATQLVRDVFDEWLDEPGARKPEPLLTRCALKACKAAVKAHSHLSIPEMEALLRQLSTLHNPFTCPHGRPTAIVLSRAELERSLLRRM
ncbi:MAG: DNA mismatch repair endonuclease MutL [Firmicutes bacterium]|nr:DNA mismatch repair endonuclease MutL [Bacillota bacterium]